MRVGIDIRWLQEAVANRALGGIGRYTLGLTTRLAGDADVVLLASPRLPFPDALDPDRTDGVVGTVAVPNCWRLPGRRLGFSAARAVVVDAVTVRAAVRRADVDVVHFMHQLSPPPRRLCRPSVLTVHDLAYLAHPRLFFGTSRAPWLYRRRLRAVSRASRLIAVSETTAKDVVKFLGIPRARVTVVHEASEPWFSAEGPSADLTLPYFIHVGGTHPSKNIGTLVTAHAMLRERTSQRVKLLVVGVSRDKLPPRVGEGVEVRSQVSDEELAAYYRGALALVCPSVIEGFGLPVLEAMACGTPVIVSSTTATGEVAGNAGILLEDPSDACELADRMCELVDRPGLRSKHSRAVLERALTFSWETTTARTLGVYRDVVRGTA